LFKLKICVHITVRPGADRHATPKVDKGGLFTIVEVYYSILAHLLIYVEVFSKVYFPKIYSMYNVSEKVKDNDDIV